MTEDRWESIIKSATARKQTKMYQKSKYRPVIEDLPSAPSMMDGYHSRFYRTFTAIQACGTKTVGDQQPCCSKDLRSTATTPLTAAEKFRVGIFDSKCLYCDKQWKTLPNGTKEGLGTVQTKNAEDKIREAAELLEENAVLVKISGIDLIAKEVKFHHSCRSKTLAATARKKGQINKIKKTEKVAITQIFNYVNSVIILESRPERLKSVYDRYCLLVNEAEEESTVSSCQYLGEILKKKFPNELRISSSGAKKQGSIVHNSLLDYKSIKVVYDFKSSDECQLITSALILRKHLKDATRKPWSEPLDLDSLMHGDGEAPELVHTFFQTLFGGRNKNSESVKRRATSASEDALFNVHNGQFLPKKHILLASLVSSTTGSRKLMTVLNRLGHCISYSKYEELETELASTIQIRKTCSPKGAKHGPVMGNAFDNYDELVHTLSGLDSLHDTMGIFYQNIDLLANEVDDEQPQIPHENDNLPKTSRKKPKRKLDILPTDIQPYRKKPRMEQFVYANAEYVKLPKLSDRARKLDTLFLMTHVNSENVPMWGGFNARLYKDKLQKQVVHYMPNLNRPITKDDVVAETMRTSLKCAEECGQNMV